jgi:transcriptional regulator with XRE-family HTH domain
MRARMMGRGVSALEPRRARSWTVSKPVGETASNQEWLGKDEFFADFDADPTLRAAWERLDLARAVGDAVLRYRIERKHSQRALAAQLGMRQSHIARVEAAEHNPSVEMLQRLSEHLGLRFVLDVAPSAAAALALPPGLVPAQEVTTLEGARVLVATG